MELRHIKYFIVVAEELHFRKAAERLNMSQPPLSQQIQSLEHELGVQLFERSKREVKLTKEGQAVLKEAYRLIENSERLQSVANQSKQGKTGRLSIGCIASAFPEVLPPIYKAFSSQYPNVELAFEELNTHETLAKLEEGDLDFGFVRINKVSPPLALYPLLRDQLVVALPEGHRLLSKKTVSLKMLETEPFVIFKRQTSPQFYDSILAACQQADFYPNIVYEGKSMQSHIGYVACGLGVALVPQSIQSVYTSGIVYRNLKEASPLTEISLVWNVESKSELIKHFIKISQKTFPSLK